MSLLITAPGLFAAEKDTLIQRALDDFEQDEPLSGSEGTARVVVTRNQEIFIEPVPVPEETPALGIRTTIDQLAFQGTDVLSVLKIIQEKSGLVIDADPGISGNVSLAVRDIDIPDALKAILEPLGLAYSHDDYQIRVMTSEQYREEFGRDFADMLQTRIIPVRHAGLSEVIAKITPLKTESGKIIPSTEPPAVIVMDVPRVLDDIEAAVQREDIRLETEVFDVHYALAPEIADKVKKQLSKDVGQIRADERANKIVVTDTVANIEAIAKLIRDLDKKKEVAFEAKIIRIELCDEHESGIDWEAIVSNYQSLQSNGGMDASGKRDICTGTVSDEDYPVLLEALDLVGEMDTFTITGNVIQNNRKTLLRLILDGDDVNLSFVSPFPRRDTDEPEPSPDSVDVSFVLTPTIHLDDSVTMALTALSGGETQKTVLALGKNQIMILGGIFREERIDETRKFPILGNIPFVGFVFRSRTTDLRRVEHIIILTPRVVVEET